MVTRDGAGSAGHVRAGQGGRTGKVSFTLQAANVLISNSSASSKKSQANFDEDAKVNADQPQSTL